VWAVTDDPGAAVCPDCGTVSGRVHEYLLTRPRDLRRGPEEVSVGWLKRRWKCMSQECWRKTFTESLPPWTQVRGQPSRHEALGSARDRA
jgi:transposase